VLQRVAVCCSVLQCVAWRLLNVMESVMESAECDGECGEDC